MDKVIEDPWAKSAVFGFSLVGVLFVSLKIFSFWRMIASLFIIPGESVSYYLSESSIASR